MIIDLVAELKGFNIEPEEKKDFSVFSKKPEAESQS